MWTFPAPNPGAADPDPAHGPLAALPSLSVRDWERIAVPLNGSLTDLARHKLRQIPRRISRLIVRLRGFQRKATGMSLAMPAPRAGRGR